MYVGSNLTMTLIEDSVHQVSGVCLILSIAESIHQLKVLGLYFEHVICYGFPSPQGVHVCRAESVNDFY